MHSNSALVNLGLESGCMTDAWYLNIYYKSVGTHGPISPHKICSFWNIKCCSFNTGPQKLLIFWSPNQSHVVPLWLDPQNYSYFDAQPEQRGLFYDCPPKLLTFRRPCNSIWILEFWRRNRRKRQSHKILISIICRSELELRNFTNFKWIIMGQLLRGFLKDGV